MNTANFTFFIGRMTRSLWFTPALYALLALGILGIAPVAAPLLPPELAEFVGLEGVYDLLEVLANSLLAVAIFSIGIMVSSMQVISGAATPRVRPLLTEDRTAQNAISTFLGGFIFAIVGIAGLSTDLYDPAARMLLFIVTCIVILAVIVALIRWIAKLSTLGDVSAVIELVEGAARKSFATHARDPHFGGMPCASPPPDGCMVTNRRIGFVQNLDADALGALAEEVDADFHLVARPGAYMDPARPLLIASRDLSEDERARVCAAFVIGAQRTYKADPRFSLIALSEIGSRALSSGVNDPGTAIHVLGTLVRILAEWSDAMRSGEAEVRHPRLKTPPLSIDDLLIDAFRWIGRDGAGLLEVQIRLQKSLATLEAHDPARFGAQARAMSDEALRRAEDALALPADAEALRALVVRLRHSPGGGDWLR